MSATAADSLAVLPASVVVRFPRADGGHLTEGSYHVVPVTLSSLLLADYRLASGSYLAGVSGAVKVFHSSAVASFALATDSTPTNAAELLALATVIATDFYEWAQAKCDLVLHGYPEWTQTGADEEVEYSHGVDAQTGLARCVTRVSRGPWLDLAEELFHLSSFTEAPDPVVFPPAFSTPPLCGEAIIAGGFFQVWNCGTGSIDYYCQCFGPGSGSGSGSGSGGGQCLCTLQCEDGMPLTWKVVIPAATGDFAAVQGDATLAWQSDCQWTVTTGAVTVVLTWDAGLAHWLLKFTNNSTGSYWYYRNRAPLACCGENEFVAYAYSPNPYAAQGYLGEELTIEPAGACVPCAGGGGGGVATNCCPSSDVPTTVHATITGGGSLDGSYALVYDAVAVAWKYTAATWGTCLAPGGHITVTCAPFGWTFSTSGSPSVYSPASVSCSPLSLVFTGLDLSGCGGAAGATATITT